MARFEPKRGLIPPKSEVRVSLTTTLYYGGIVDELFVCNIEDLEVPLGFELKADSFGLNVSHEVAGEPNAGKNHAKNSKRESMANTSSSIQTVVSSFSEVQ